MDEQSYIQNLGVCAVPKNGEQNLNNKTYLLSYHEIITEKSWTFEHRLAAVSELFRSIVGEFCPVEDLALAVSIDKHLCKDILHVLEEVLKYLDDDNFLELHNLNAYEMVYMLLSARVLSVCLRLLCIHAIYSDLLRADQVKEMLTINYIFRIRFACIQILLHIAGFKKLDHKEWKLEFTNPDLFPTLSQCAKNETSIINLVNIMLLFMKLFEKHAQQPWFEFYAKVMDSNMFIEFLQKDALVDRVTSWANKGINKFEEKALAKTGIKYCKNKCNEFFIHQVLTWCIQEIHPVCVDAIKKLSEIPSISRKVQTALHYSDILFNSLDWCQIVPLTDEDCCRIVNSINLLSVVVKNSESFTNKIFHHQRFLNSIKFLIQHPDADIFLAVINLMDRMVESMPALKEKFVNEKDILHAIIDRSFSPDFKIQQTALLILFDLTDKRTVYVLLRNGFGALKLYQLRCYYKHPGTGPCPLIGLRNKIATYAKHEWKDEVDYVKAYNQKSVSYLNIGLMKTRGNTFLDNGNYDKAIKEYSAALEVCPLSLRHHDGSLHSPGSQIPIVTKWYDTPTFLYSNRALCYLYLGEYQKAYEDCSKAIALIYSRSGIAAQVGLSSVCRSISAKQLRGCSKRCKLVHNKYRQIVGSHFTVKRCIWCLKGEWAKLKACGNCGETYCSKRCQYEAWKAGHKDVCQSRKVFT
uniref:MYND-type domain-containing protein n=1 Tax=Strigamia maritima TaxID=126957 RepID=T1J552_STRMM